MLLSRILATAVPLLPLVQGSVIPSLGRGLNPRVSSEVVLDLIQSNSGLTSAQCGIGSVSDCINGAVLAVLNNFYSLYTATGPTDGPARRSIANITTGIHDQWMPSTECSSLCKLKANSTEGEWTSVGTTAINGVIHEVHFQQVGSMLGVKAGQATAGASNRKRDDVSDDGGYVAAYFWEDNNFAVWSDWAADDVQPIAELVSNYIIDNEAQVACADIIVDNDGAMNAGVITANNNNVEYGLTQSQWTNFLSICLSDDPNSP